MCKKSKNGKPDKYDVIIATRKAPRVLIVFIVACSGVKSASLDRTLFAAIKIIVLWRSKTFKTRTMKM